VDLIADTTFLVGLWRKQPWAMLFAAEQGTKVLGIPWVVLGEFWHGAVRAGHERTLVSSFLDLGIPLLDTGEVIATYAEICVRLQEADLPDYRSISQNDLWIAAVAVHWNLPLVSRNRRHFEKIAGLRLIAPSGE
jgi:predicted nucleic acid-binding protein